MQTRDLSLFVMVMASAVLKVVPVLLGEPCTNSNECTTLYSKCSVINGRKICICVPGHYKNPWNNACTEVPPECTGPSDCSAHGECAAGVCRCIPDWYPIGDVCYKGDLGDLCDDSNDLSQCDEDPNSHCPGPRTTPRLCRCDCDFVPVGNPPICIYNCIVGPWGAWVKTVPVEGILNCHFERTRPVLVGDPSRGCPDLYQSVRCANANECSDQSCATDTDCPSTSFCGMHPSGKREPTCCPSSTFRPYGEAGTPDV